MNRPKDLLRSVEAQTDEFELVCRAFTEATVDAVITSNAGDRILYWNPGAERMFGHGQEIVGQPVTRIIPPRYRRAHSEGVRHFLETGSRRILGRSMELEALKADGTVFPIELTLSTWQGREGPFFGAIIRDISERKRTERLREDVHRLMRHDLKSPLVGVVGFARRLIASPNLGEAETGLARRIEELGRRMLDMIDRTRQLHSMEEGDFHLAASPVDLSLVARQVGEQLEPLFQRGGVRLSLENRLGREAVVQGDATLLFSLVENLLKNAVEASPRGEAVEVAILPGSSEDSGLVLEIHNRGEVPPEVAGRFFEPYVTGGKEGGLGLGTHSAKLITEVHGGKIGFSSSAGDGTRVRVSLPAVSPEA